MALNATTCYNKAVVAGYGSYPSPLAASVGLPSAVMVAAAAAAAGSAASSASVGSSSAATGSRSGSSGSGSGSAGSGYRVKDFNVPLHVDCSVEYEMPSSAKPPVGGKVEPLLMIHPSYYRKAESRTRSLFVNNMPAAAASASGRSRPTVMASATAGATVCGGRPDAAMAAAVQANTAADGGPPPAKKPYAGPAPGVTASTAGVYGMVAGAVAAAAGAAQWPPLGSSAEHQHHEGKRTLDMVQRQYQQHLQASLPPPMMTAALPTDKTHMTVSKGCSCCQAKLLKRKAQQPPSVPQPQPQPHHLQIHHHHQQQQQQHHHLPQPSHIQQQQQQQQQQLHHHQQQQQQQQQQQHQQQQQQQHHQHLHLQQQQHHHQQQQQQQQLHHHHHQQQQQQQQHQEYHKVRQNEPAPQLWGFNGTIAAVLRNEYGSKQTKTLGRITDPINQILTPTYMF